MSWYERVPKVELHLHLEGAIPHDALWPLLEKYGGDPSVPDLAALGRKFVYRDFDHFIETWLWMIGFLREYDDFTLCAEAVARDLARQNIRYVEAFFSPGDFARHGLAPQGLARAIRAGLDRVPAVEVRLVGDLVRNYGPEAGARTLAALAEVREEAGIVGIGIGGAEAGFPPEPYAAVYADARQRGFRTSAHAGEAAGAASVWGAVRSLRVDRIGHGTRAAEDPALIDHLARHRIPLEMCPLSNVATAVVDGLAEHPVRRFFERGLLVTINTDDPQMFGNSLAEEYRGLIDMLGFCRDDIRTLIMNAVDAAWLPAAESQRLARSLEADPAWAG